MKVPQSVRVLYQELRSTAEALKSAVDSLIVGKKQRQWHYESRIKEEESFALKLETGRVADPKALDDFFACTLVVENAARIGDAEEFVSRHFRPRERRPRAADKTHLAPHSFAFDDLRLYVNWVDDAGARPKGLDGMLFEIQVKTFLQHAWGIATHDFVYKADDVDWPSSRIAYQVKAMLESAEVSIGEAQKLTGAPMLCRSDRKSDELHEVIIELKARWDVAQLPADLRRLADTVSDLKSMLGLDWSALWAMLDDATETGEGTKTLNLSPHGAIIAALIRSRGAALFEPLLAQKSKRRLFIPLEIDLPTLPAPIAARIIRPMASKQ